ncbi:uncharacterized protein LOC131853427 isoform X1 [Achroia grisella]|uniref:uncharacterized protein LOC131853427 isoform X1 n=1 Tax=Achroia grisella TaxID=688607 RepID=UPI0027D1F5B3|nr:uncharacterized protein LOC131853427 isoform X1 [Achroia grisella]
MPASNFDLYNMQDARNNFDATRPAPICSDANQFMGQCPSVHISTNRYYGYHGTKNNETQVTRDCEMAEEPHVNTSAVQPLIAKKRSAEDGEYPRNKRVRQEVQRERNKPEINTTKGITTDTEDILETLYWNIHGGNIYHLRQCL